MAKGGVDGRRRNGQHPNSRAALRPTQPGDILNPTGKSGEPYRVYTEAIQTVGMDPLPEYLRVALNHRFRKLLATELTGVVLDDGKPVTMPAIPDMYEAGITWAQANALRLHVSAVMNGDIGAAVECREATEGRATTRIEFSNGTDKLDSLLQAFRSVAKMSHEEYEAATSAAGYTTKPKVVQ